MDELEKFRSEVKNNIAGLIQDEDIQALSLNLLREITRHKYVYNFSWMGRPIIQTPQDIIAMQEIIWDVKPDLIIETGIAHGGSLIFHASMLELLGGDGKVIGIDVDIRKHNRTQIEKHPMFDRITLIEGSSIDEDIVKKVYALAESKKRILLILDSNHTHDHVLQELKFYSPLVKKGCYLVVFDTTIEDLPDDLFLDRPWNKSNNPKTAVRDFLKTNPRFIIDKELSGKLLITAAIDGYLKCIRD